MRPSVAFVAPLTEERAFFERVLESVRAGWQVHVLTPSLPASTSTWQALIDAGVRLASLDQMPVPAPLALHGPNSCPLLDRSDHVRGALAELHRLHGFARIEFADGMGLGFRSIQAKRCGLEFVDVPLAVRVMESTQRVRQRHEEWLDRPEQLVGDFCERYAWEHADERLADDPSLSAELRPLGWNAKNPTVLPLSPPPAPALHRPLFKRAGERGGRTPLVTICVAHYNLGAYLGEALASLAAQTYPALEVFVIDDGSTDADAIRVFAELKTRNPQFHFLNQENAGIGATRNRGLVLARGEYFLPMDADNVARPDMVARLVDGLEHAPDMTALACYFLAFEEASDLSAGRFLYAYKPTAGPHVLGCLQNVYGDANALFRTSALRALGGFTTDRDISFEDWELFVRLVNARHEVDVLPEFLFYYRHRPGGFSRSTSAFQNHQRVLRQYCDIENLPRSERLALWNFLAGQSRRLEELEAENRSLRFRLGSARYQVSDRFHALFTSIPGLKPTARWLRNWCIPGSRTRNATAERGA